MALINSFTEKTPERDIGGAGAGKYLQIDTYGSPDRMMAGKVSQSIRLDARAAAELRVLIDRAFPR